MTTVKRDAAPCRERARSWARDPAVWAWTFVGLLALLPLGAALV